MDHKVDTIANSIQLVKAQIELGVIDRVINNENSKINTVNEGGSPMMAMMKTWNNQGFVVKCSKRNDDYTTKNQNNKST